MKLLLVYLLLVNAIGLLLMRTDKNNARKKLWRIPERLLIGIAIAGGSFGILLSMYLFRHKTKHTIFTATVPLLFILQTVLFLLCLCR